MITAAECDESKHARLEAVTSADTDTVCNQPATENVQHRKSFLSFTHVTTASAFSSTAISTVATTQITDCIAKPADFHVIL